MVLVKSSAEVTPKHLEAALALRAGIAADDFAKSEGEAMVEAAMKDADMPLAALLGECLRLEGKSVPRAFDNAAIKAACSIRLW